jgi:hypothetical protein
MKLSHRRFWTLGVKSTCTVGELLRTLSNHLDIELDRLALDLIWNESDKGKSAHMHARARALAR